MEIKTNSVHEQNNSMLGCQKIEKQILFGKTGLWTRYFNALKFFGIDVSGLIIENNKLKEENESIKGHNQALKNVIEFYKRELTNEKGHNEAFKTVIEFYKNELATENLKAKVLKEVN